MKYITFAIPCYNSQDYMERAVESVLKGGKDVEIIIVNDGSKDGTEEIGKRYEREYPDIVRVISQENGGHGEAVNTGLLHATGKYFKVVDSDDWLDEEALIQVLNQMKSFEEKDEEVDMFISNYVYEKVGGRLGTAASFMGYTRVSNPKPGDICCNDHHCGIYIGDGQMIHAPRTGDVVKISAVHSGMIYTRY